MDKKIGTCMLLILTSFTGILSIFRLEIDTNLITGTMAPLKEYAKFYILPFLFFFLFVVFILIYSFCFIGTGKRDVI